MPVRADDEPQPASEPLTEAAAKALEEKTHGILRAYLSADGNWYVTREPGAK